MTNATTKFDQNWQIIGTRLGPIYIEKIGYQEEEDRLKIYDSDGRYLSYLGTDYGTKELVKSDIKKDIERIKKADDIFDLVGMFCESFTASKDWGDLIDDLRQENMICFSENGEIMWAGDGTICTKDSLTENEYVNRIGDYYILITEY